MIKHDILYKSSSALQSSFNSLLKHHFFRLQYRIISTEHWKRCSTRIYQSTLYLLRSIQRVFNLFLNLFLIMWNVDVWWFRVVFSVAAVGKPVRVHVAYIPVSMETPQRQAGSLKKLGNTVIQPRASLLTRHTQSIHRRWGVQYGVRHSQDKHTSHIENC